MDDLQWDEMPMLPINIPRSFRKSGSWKRRNIKRVVPEVRHEHLLRSGPLAKCNNPLCTTCPTYLGEMDWGGAPPPMATPSWFLHHLGNFKSAAKGIINPHAKFVQRWNKVFVISCLMAIFVDPLFFFLLRVDEDHKCIVMDRAFAMVMVVLRSFTDLVYLLHIILQFRLAIIASPALGADMPSESLIDNPRKIAWNYVTHWFLVDVLAMLPVPQVMILVFIPKYLGKSAGADYAKNLLRVTLLVQLIPRIVRVVPLLSGHGSTGFIFETAWANFVINLLMYVLAGHVVGSCWYLFGLQRVNQCLHDACRNATSSICRKAFLDCGDGLDIVSEKSKFPTWTNWTNDINANNCFGDQPYVFTFGIYAKAVSITATKSAMTRYLYSAFWGFQQISTLAGNQMPSLFIWEVLFLICVIGLGLMLLTLLIGNMQKFLQSLGRRGLEMQLRRYEVEKWMSRRNLPIDVRRRVRNYERLNWHTTQGLVESELLDILPEDLHTEIRRDLFMGLVKEVRLLGVMDQQLVDAIIQRLHHKLYIEGSEILRRGSPVTRLLFIVFGQLISEGEDGRKTNVTAGDICGEELLTWCLEHADEKRRRTKHGNKRYYRSGQRAVATRTTTCKSNVEAFALELKDLEELTRDFSRLFRNPRLYAAIRFESPTYREWAATTIQVHWRYWKRKMKGTSRNYRNQ